MRRRKRRYDMKKVFLVILVLLLLLILAGYGIYTLLWNPVVEEVQLEAGEEIKIGKFLKEENEKASFVTDTASIDTSILGEHEITLKINNREFVSKLYIVDTIAPAAEPVEVVTEAGTVPDAAQCVTNIVDKTAVTVTYKEQPDVSAGGDVPAVVLLTDEAGNTAEVMVTLKVWADKEPPVISGTSDKVVTIGGSVSYRTNVTVTDNKDENPSLEIDNSKVDLNKAGKYEVVYTATDASGNVSTQTITVTVKEKGVEVENGQINEAAVEALAKKVLDNITNESMSDMEVAFEIYKWTTRNIAYVGSADKSSWVKGAYQAFTKKSGDCYTYFAAAKALFRAAGIENVDVVKSDTSRSSHYWSLINIGTGWYHVDCTPRKGSGDLFFMVTDAELEAYSSTHQNSHIFDKGAYPARATESVQSKVDYSAGKIKD